MMRALVLLHRWLGVALCLLFAMWFASGIVMHFVPFPDLTEAERFAGLAPLDLTRVENGPATAVGASGITGVTRVRLVQRSDGPVYLVSRRPAVKAVRADDLADGAVRSAPLALAIALDYARRRQLDLSDPHVDVLTAADQWTVSGIYNRDRPLYRVALNDSLGTELYVSSTTGEIVLATTRRERIWNYFGSVPHWIYPTALRSRPAEWTRLVWWLSLVALIGVTAGMVVGVMRIEINGRRPQSPYRGWQAWHHVLGLCCMLFVWTWIFSGWLSMDDGQLFSTGRPNNAELASVTGVPTWNALSSDEVRRIGPAVREVEWFAFDGQVYRRERIGLNRQRLIGPDPRDTTPAGYLDADALRAVAGRLVPACQPPVVVAADDAYPAASVMQNAPVFRLVCGDDWFDIDAANGALLQKLDASRRTYRWVYGALHRLNIAALTSRPALRSSLIVILCGFGFVFSLTGVVIGWRRLRSCLQSPR
jgi:hypothetical protein